VNTFKTNTDAKFNIHYRCWSRSSTDINFICEILPPSKIDDFSLIKRMGYFLERERERERERRKNVKKI